MPGKQVRGVNIFYCYAIEDIKYLYALEKYLQGLRHLGRVIIWRDRQLLPGGDWEAEIGAPLNAADIILLLISPSFMYSNFCLNVEMLQAFKRHNSIDKITIIPIILCQVNWQNTIIRDFITFSSAGTPVTLWENPAKGYQVVASRVSQAVKSLLTAQWRDEARTFFMLGSYEESLHAYDEVLRLDRKKADIYQDKGHVLVKSGRLHEALEAYTMAISLKPDEALFYIHKGHAFRHMKRYSEAVVVYEQALRLDPANPYPLIHKGYALLGMQRPAEALISFEQALRLNPNIGFGYTGQGAALQVLKHPEQARMAYSND